MTEKPPLLRFCDTSAGHPGNGYRTVRIGGWVPGRKAERRAARAVPAPAGG